MRILEIFCSVLSFRSTRLFLNYQFWGYNESEESSNPSFFCSDASGKLKKVRCIDLPLSLRNAKYMNTIRMPSSILGSFDYLQRKRKGEVKMMIEKGVMLLLSTFNTPATGVVL